MVIIVIAVDFIPLEIAGKATILETSWRKFCFKWSESDYVLVIMSFVRFTRCRNHGDDSDLPVTQEQIEREILPLMEKPDCFIISFTSLKNLYVDNLDKLGLVAYSVPSEERVFMKLGHKLYTVA